MRSATSGATKTTRNPKPSSAFKRVTIDFEISPEFVAAYGKHYEAKVLGVERYQYAFCFSYKVNDEPTKCVALPDFPLYKKDPFNDIHVIEEARRVISEADVVVAHNIKFDMGVLRSRSIYHGLSPIRPPRTFCTLQAFRRLTHLNSYSLKECAIHAGVTHKHETSKGLWQGIHYRRDPKSWKEMTYYCNKDVDVDHELDNVIRGWTGAAPKPYLDALCQECGSDDVQFRGAGLTRLPTKRFQCKNCFKWGHIRI